ncbi:MAG: hypothetical protein SH809_17825 [Rhodothermales bacterium]|nr:hypothetical protein [Rhodothermales bacterium]
MQQTLLALGALLIVTTISMNQQRSIFMLQRTAYLRELEAAASDYAQLRLSEVASFAFDEARVGMATLNTDFADLTSSGAFGVESGETAGAPATFDDIDDFHGLVDSTITHTLSNETYPLRASYTVQYVDPTAPGSVPSGGFKSLIKVVILTVETREAIDAGYVRIIERRSIAVSDYV